MLSWTAVWATLAAAFPRDVGLVVDEDGGRLVARLAVPAADLRPYCRPGPDGELEPLDLSVVRATTGWTVGSRASVFLGPRRVASAQVTDLAIGEACDVEALLEPEEPVPWTTRSDVVWVTLRERPSSAPVAPRRRAVRAAERAAADGLGAAFPDPRQRAECLAELRATGRGTKEGAVVGVACELADGGSFSALYYVPRGGEPLSVRPIGYRPEGPVVLLELMTPQATRVFDVILEVPGPTGRERRWERLRVPPPT